ncbi:MAG: F0F1 ATP synthase subunit delta [Microgenomates group bacterium]
MVNSNGKNNKTVEIISAYPLSEDEISTIKETPVFKNREIRNIVDKKIIAGLVIKYDDNLIDLSFSSFLDNLKNNLYEK